MAPKRLALLDSARGLALLLMAAYHLAFDLHFFKGYSIGIESGCWLFFARAIAASFLFIAGAALCISDSRLGEKERGRHHFKRGAYIFGAGMLVTAATVGLYPAQGIWFGILHCIGACVMLFWPLAGLGRWNLAMAAALLVAGFGAGGVALSFPWLLWLGFAPAGFQSFDYVPLIPWAAPFLLGLWAGKPILAWLKKSADFGAGNLGLNWLAWLGRNSLLFYLVHQPVLVAMVLAFG